MIDTVLVVDDDVHVREALGQTLELAGYRVRLAGSFVAAKDHITRDFAGVILSDIRMPGRDGLYLLEHAQRVDDDLPVILLTGEGDIPMAVGAINKGAFDFLEKPCANDVLTDAIRKAMQARALVLENRALRSEIARGDAAARMIFGGSDRAEALRARLRQLAQIDDAVHISGGPGSGVAKAAEIMHLLSDRAGAPLARVAGGDLTPAQLQALLRAHAQGAVYIDEFTALPRPTQHDLLAHLDARVGGQAGARIYVGTTDDQSGDLVADLRYRLDALRLHVPALKDRAEDIPVIFRHYVRQMAEQLNAMEPDVTPEVIAGLLAQDWPGNTRALMNAAMRFVLGLETPLGDAHLGLVDKLAQVERTLIIEALQQNRGNASATAQHLRLPRKTFYDKLARHGIKPETYR
ncbi:MAG: response regulator [Marinibacterium sp.]|nr:response regulator [Marinibacterium sp.]